MTLGQQRRCALMNLLWGTAGMLKFLLVSSHTGWPGLAEHRVATESESWVLMVWSSLKMIFQAVACSQLVQAPSWCMATVQLQDSSSTSAQVSSWISGILSLEPSNTRLLGGYRTSLFNCHIVCQDVMSQPPFRLMDCAHHFLPVLTIMPARKTLMLKESL